MTDLDAIHENRQLSRWATLLPLLPEKCGELHHTDSELVSLGDGRLLALNVDSVVEEVRYGLYDPFLAGYVAVIAALSDLAAVGAELAPHGAVGQRLVQQGLLHRLSPLPHCTGAQF